MNTRILQNIEGQFCARSSARMLTEEEMDAIAGGGLIYEYKEGTYYVNEEEMRWMFFNDRARYEKNIKELDGYKANGSKLGTIVLSLFAEAKYLDIPPAIYGEQGVSA